MSRPKTVSNTGDFESSVVCNGYNIGSAPFRLICIGILLFLILKIYEGIVVCKLYKIILSCFFTGMFVIKLVFFAADKCDGLLISIVSIQIAAGATFLALVFAFYIFFLPFVECGILRVLLCAAYSPMVTPLHSYDQKNVFVMSTVL
jgi:hypothetical protein